jgi:hypothetical protein
MTAPSRREDIRVRRLPPGRGRALRLCGRGARTAPAQSVRHAGRLGRKERTQEQLIRRHTENSEAHDAYIKGCFWGNKRDEEGFRKGIDYFQSGNSP